MQLIVPWFWEALQDSRPWNLKLELSAAITVVEFPMRIECLAKTTTGMIEIWTGGFFYSESDVLTMQP